MIPEPATLAVFAVAALALLVVPGPAVLYIVARGVAGGRRAGLVSMLGVQAGGLVHVAAAVAGLSSLLLSSATAFAAVKYAGAAYLLALGAWTLLRGHGQEEQGHPAARTGGRLFAQGALVQVLNPKTALFFFAFLPQFVEPGRGSAAGQIAVLGLVFVALALVTDGAYAVAAGTLAGRMRAARRLRRWISGGVFFGLGITTALSGRPARLGQ